MYIIIVCARLDGRLYYSLIIRRDNIIRVRCLDKNQRGKTRVYTYIIILACCAL